MRKKIIVLVGAIVFAVCLMGSSASAEASADAAVDNCYGHSTRSANYVKNNYSGHRWGAVQLCQDSGGFFAVYINYNLDTTQQGPMPYGQFANAWIYRYHNGVYYGRMSCDTSGGNGHVTPGRIACYTPRSGVGDGVSFRAAAFGYVLDGNEWVHVASGWSATINS
ncbi:hypothetical protein [Actinophytocola sp. NPDC049390]|uniref:hypothetical protein n=1 Tax=Actinophytocola sp. NPDC049390 TaxID=3363894 RepID=UPI0037A26B23